MRRLVVLVVLLVILIAGGGLTMQLISGGGSLLPVLTQVNSPDAAPTVVLPWKAEQFFLLVSFILFNLIGIAATLALVFWLLDGGLRRQRAKAAAAEAAATSAVVPVGTNK
ncbi:MAG: hypothetical protein SGI73_18950 [Chloroflexota bacterium]|nr:hypothetical protein [Chloroflexota bacterium]